MLVAAYHVIHEPDEFWATAHEHLAKTPEGIRLVQMAVSANGRVATCLWQSPTVDEVHDWIYGLVGHLSENEYFEIEPRRSSGLP